MVTSRAAAAVRQARRARARLDAWILREGAGGRERLRRGPASSPASVPVPVPVPVPAPVQAPESLPVVLARALTPQVPSAARGGLERRKASSSSPEDSARRSRSSPRSSPRSSSRSSPRSSPRSVRGSQESDSRLGTSSGSKRPSRSSRSEGIMPGLAASPEGVGGGGHQGVR